GRDGLAVHSLFGALEKRETAYAPPTTDVKLRRRARLELPLVLNELPRLVGPGGQLVIVGVGNDDWLDLEAVALSVTDLPEGSVHWFAAPEQPVAEDHLRELFGNRIQFHSRVLAEELAATSSDDDLAALSHAREQILHPASRQITVRRGGAAK